MRNFLYSKRFYSRIFIVNQVHAGRFLLGDTCNLQEEWENFKDIYKDMLSIECQDDLVFIEELYKGIADKHDAIESFIKEKVSSPIKIDFVDDILYCGINELLLQELEFNIIINEYTSIVSFFFKSYTGLVNAVMQAVANDLKNRPAE